MKYDLFETPPPIKFEAPSVTVNLSVAKAEPKPFGLADMIALQFLQRAVDDKKTEDVEANVRLAYWYARTMVRVRAEN